MTCSAKCSDSRPSKHSHKLSQHDLRFGQINRMHGFMIIRLQITVTPDTLQKAFATYFFFFTFFLFMLAVPQFEGMAGRKWVGMKR